jgi:hypothetical protein
MFANHSEFTPFNPRITRHFSGLIYFDSVGFGPISKVGAAFGYIHRQSAMVGRVTPCAPRLPTGPCKKSYQWCTQNPLK